MSDKCDLFDEKNKASFPNAAEDRQPALREGQVVRPAPSASRRWRTLEWFKALIGEPSLTSLPDLNQENP